MSITKLQLGLAGAVAVAGATSYVVQAQQREQLQAELEQLRTQETAITVLRQENEQLSREAVEASDLRRDDAELARLRDEADALRVKLLAAARSQDANATIYEVNQLDQLPAPSTRVPPVYPTEMREAGIGGEVLVDFIVDVNGEVKNAFAKKSTHREFEAAAVEAVSKWVFRAGRKNGRQINTHMQVPIVFSPRSGAESGTPQPVPNPNGWF
jgi:TonB family protein